MLTSVRQRGLSLIELMVVVIIMALLLALAMPNFSAWIASSRVRATAENLSAGLYLAQSEASTRNTHVRFQLTSSIDASCALDANGAAWVVDVVDPADDSVAGRCNTAPSDTVAPSILQTRAPTEAGGRVQVSGTADQVVFNGLKRLVPLNGAVVPARLTISVAPAGDLAQCAVRGGPVTCLNVTVSPLGEIRTCNPNVAAGDPQAC